MRYGDYAILRRRLPNKGYSMPTLETHGHKTTEEKVWFGFKVFGISSVVAFALYLLSLGADISQFAVLFGLITVASLAGLLLLSVFGVIMLKGAKRVVTLVAGVAIMVIFIVGAISFNEAAAPLEPIPELQTTN